jgi:HemY protein
MWVTAMNRLAYILLISLITVVGFIMYKQDDIGKVNLTFADYSFETNLVVLSAAILGLIFLFLVIVKLISLIKNSFFYLGKKHRSRQKEKAREALPKGLIEYAEGRFAQAEKTLLQQVKYSDNRLLVYLSAARAAQQLGGHDRRDEYLRKAHLETPEAEIAISLTKAELQLAHDQDEQALATLSQLNEQVENHPYVLTLLANTYKHLHDWDNLKTILPTLKKHTKLSAESFLSFEVLVCNGQMSLLAKKPDHLNSVDSESLIHFWTGVPSHLKILPEVIEHYVRLLNSIGDSNEAEQVLRQYINKNWQDSSIVLYSELDDTELDTSAEKKQLETVESWLKKHPQNAYLLLALGKMCLSRSFWGKAKNYLEASIAINPMPENYLKLARLLEENMNEPDAAQEYYRQGLHRLAGDYNEAVLDKKIAEVNDDKLHLKIVKS